MVTNMKHNTLIMIVFLAWLSCVDHTTLGQNPIIQPISVPPKAPFTGLNVVNMRKSQFSDDSKLLFTINQQNQIEVWELSTGVSRGSFTLGMPNTLYSWKIFELADKKAILVVGTSGTAYVLSMVDAKLVTKYDMPIAYPATYMVLDDGKTLVKLNGNSEITFYDAATGKIKEKETITLKPNTIERDSGISLSPDGQTYAVNKRSKLTITELKTGKERYSYSIDPKQPSFYFNGLYAPIYSGDGRTVAFQAVNGVIHIVNTETGKEIRSITNEVFTPIMKQRSFTPAPVTLSHNGRWILVSTDSVATELLMIGTYSGLEMRRFPSWIVSSYGHDFSLNKDATLLAGSGNGIQGANVWDVLTSTTLVLTPKKK